MRRTLYVALILGVGLASCFSGTAGAKSTTLVANCGNVGFLFFKPSYWSAGCTAGSPLIKRLDWESYSANKAAATGIAPVQDCGCAEPTAVARYPARLALTAPRRCGSNPRLRYFSEAELTVSYPEGNPFGVRAGEHATRSHVAAGRCDFAPLRLSGGPTTDVATRRGWAAPRYFMSCGEPPTYDPGLELYFHGHIDYRSHPRACYWSENGSTAYLINLVKIRWHGWGSPRARAEALRVDNHDMDHNGFQRHRVRITLFAPRPAVGHPGLTRLYYTKLRISESSSSGVENLFRPGEPTVELPDY
jgi:hypothetical protein